MSEITAFPAKKLNLRMALSLLYKRLSLLITVYVKL